MKRLLSFLLALGLALGCFSAAQAAKISITEQPETQTVKKGGNVTFSLKAKNSSGSGITWYFMDPKTGKIYTGKQISGEVPGLKVKGPNSQNITLSKVPESMHGWILYCHLGPRSGGINSDKVMILIDGMEVPAALATLNDTPAQADEEEAASSGAQLVAAPTPVPEDIVIQGNAKIELLATDNKGNPVGSPVPQLSFTPPDTASFYVRIPEGTEGVIQYVTVDSVRLIPDGEVRGMAVRGWPTSASIRIKVLKPGEAEQQAVEQLILPQETEAPVDPSTLVTVTCENCRFTGYHSTGAESGQVPIGTEITVFASGGVVGKGYFINGEKKAVHKNDATFRLLIEGDTTITMQKQK